MTLHRLVPQGRASSYFDLLRGIAAVYVMLFHFRQQMFVGISNISHPSLILKGIYLLTSIGYQFVMAFFVLSGFLISTNVVKQIHTGQWSWKRYLTSRLVRLWLVLIPGLLLTVGWDKFAILSTGNVEFYHSTLNWSDFIGSMFFLQGITTSTYGQNIPLWSLSYEFWYYILFPCITLALTSRRLTTRILYSLAAIAIATFVGKTIILYFFVWILGFVVAICPGIIIKRPLWRAVMLTTAIVFTTGVMVVGKLVQYHTGDGNMLQSFPSSFSTGLAFAIVLYLVLHLFNHEARGIGVNASFKVSKFLSGMSYSLYLTHCPVILALRVIIGYESLKPTVSNSVLAVCICLGIMGYAWMISRLTEAHTSKIRSWIMQRSSRQQGRNRVTVVT